MTERERLIELLEEENAFSRYMTDDERRLKLADYLLENGVFVPLVRTGDTVYTILDTEWDVAEYVIYYSARVEIDKIIVRFNAECHSHEDVDDIVFYDYDIGKTVFLTKEEAEATAKELKKNEG